MHWILIFQNSIQSEYRKIRTRKNSVFGYFSRSDKHIKRKYKITNYFKFSKIAYEGILKEVNNLDNKIKAWYIINILFKRQELNLWLVNRFLKKLNTYWQKSKDLSKWLSSISKTFGRIIKNQLTYRSSQRRCSVKKLFLKFRKIHRKILVSESLFK